jgi:hypothetical protein
LECSARIIQTINRTYPPLGRSIRGFKLARTAEYSIKGYLYQFLKYLEEVLAASEGATVTIEGAIEDIDVNLLGSVTAFQCKYHEQSEKFTLSKIYKPVLLMLEHFSAQPMACANYVLFCHFPDKEGEEQLSPLELKTVLETNAANLKPIVSRISTDVDLDTFSGRFRVIFGPTAEKLQSTVIAAFETKGFLREDIPSIVFPFAIQRIVDISTKGSVAERTLKPAEFLQSLRAVKQVTFTRWTRELASRKQIFERLRKDLKERLNLNSRRRCFVIDPTEISDFEIEIVRFIKNFVDKYSHKFLHDHPPLFVLVSPYNIGGLCARLFEAGVHCTTGDVGGGEFRASQLFRAPMRRSKPYQSEFAARLASLSQLPTIIGQEPDEIYLVNIDKSPWELSATNVHALQVDKLSDMEFALQLRGTYE